MAVFRRYRPARPTAPAEASSNWAWAAVGLTAGLLGGLLLFAPATWLAWGVWRATSGQVVLAEPRGTVWNGSARLVLTGGAGSQDAAALPGRLGWRLSPGLGGLNASVLAACCTRTPLAMTLQPRWRGGQVVVDDGLTQWPPSLLMGLGTPWNTLELDGQLGLRTRGLSVEWIEGRLVLAGRIELEALRMSSRLSTLKPMGSYRITLNGGASSTLQVDTLEGALQLSGSGRWVGSRLRFQGEATASPEREAALSNLLNIIGRRNGARSIITIG